MDLLFTACLTVFDGIVTECGISREGYPDLSYRAPLLNPNFNAGRAIARPCLWLPCLPNCFRSSFCRCCLTTDELDVIAEEQESWLEGEGSLNGSIATKDGYQRLLDNMEDEGDVEPDGHGAAARGVEGHPVWDKIAAKKPRAYTPTQKMQYGTMTGEQF